MGPRDDLPREARPKGLVRSCLDTALSASGLFCGWIIWGRTTWDQENGLYVSSGSDTGYTKEMKDRVSRGTYLLRGFCVGDESLLRCAMDWEEHLPGVSSDLHHFPPCPPASPAGPSSALLSPLCPFILQVSLFFKKPSPVPSSFSIYHIILFHTQTAWGTLSILATFF